MMADHAHIRGLHHVTAIASGAQANVLLGFGKSVCQCITFCFIHI
jgi:hypothetical protein